MFTKQHASSFPWHNVKDRILEEEVTERLTQDKRTNGMEISLHVQGSVVQAEGNLSSLQQLQMLRTFLAQHEGIYAVWDTIHINGKPPAVADIGCGNTKQVREAFGIDKTACEEVDMVTDLEKPLPLKDNTFDTIFAVHVLEHVHNLLSLMNELHRILRPNGMLHVITPLWQYPTAVADPTHVRFMNQQTIKYFCEEKPASACWKPLKVTVSHDSIFADLQPMKNGETTKKADLARWFY